MDIIITKKNSVRFILCIVLFTGMIKIAIGTGFIHTFDLFWYRDWAVDLPNGIFDIYNRADSIKLDYPPLYLFPLYLIGLVYKVIGTDANMYAQMFVLKIVPIIFDIAGIWVIYKLFANKDMVNIGVAGAVLWALNPSMFFSSAIWGQTDQVIAVLLLITFYFLEEKRLVAAGIMFAVCGLTKYQALFFLPVFLAQLFRKYGIKASIKSISAAAATLVGTFIPFMIGARKVFLIFDVYLTGYDAYEYGTLQAYNLYSIFGLNWKPDTVPVFSVDWLDWLTWKTLSNVFLVLIVMAIIVLFAFGKRTCSFIGGMFIMQCLFVFITRMHERYQLIILPFALMAWLVHRKPAFFGIFAVLSAFTLINQSLVLFNILSRYHVPWTEIHNSVIHPVFGVLNIMLTVYIGYETIKFFFGIEDFSKKDRIRQKV